MWQFEGENFTQDTLSNKILGDQIPSNIRISQKLMIILIQVIINVIFLCF